MINFEEIVGGSPSIIAVDDNLNDLNAISTALFKKLMPHLAIEHDIATITNEYKNSGRDVRLLFLDINLTNMTATNDEKQFAGIILQLLEALAPKGPYVVFFWSSMTESIDLISLDSEIRSQYNLETRDFTIYIKYETLSKSTFFANPEESMKKVIVDEHLLPLIIWESKVKNAAASTVNEITQLAHKLEQLNDLYQLIIEKFRSEKEPPSRANILFSGLMPILNRNLSKVPQDGELAIEYKPVKNMDLDAFLNKKYIFDNLSEDNFCRGIWLEIPNDDISEKILKSVILEMKKNFFIRETISNECASSIIEKSKIGLIEISPSCDHAQGRIGTHKYLLSLYLEEIPKKGRLAGERISCMANMLLFDYSFCLSFSCNDPQIKELTPLFKIDPEVVTLINRGYAVHLTRIGSNITLGNKIG